MKSVTYSTSRKGWPLYAAQRNLYFSNEVEKVLVVGSGAETVDPEPGFGSLLPCG